MVHRRDQEEDGEELLRACHLRIGREGKHEEFVGRLGDAVKGRLRNET